MHSRRCDAVMFVARAPACDARPSVPDNGPVFNRVARSRTGLASSTVYRRADAYYVIGRAITTDGVWLFDGEPAIQISLDGSAIALGSAIESAISGDLPIVRHPARDEWAEDIKRRYAPLLRQARVQSRKAFEAGAAMASIDRDGDEVVVIPMKQDTRKPDLWLESPAQATSLTRAGAEVLGNAVALVLAKGSAQYDGHSPRGA